MRKIFFITFFVFLVWNGPLWADAPGGYETSLDGLSAKEEEALRLSAAWSEKPLKPIQVGGGKVVYIHGATLPTIIGEPLRICDIELEAGEIANDLFLGDTARWVVESSISGNNVTHVLVKPIDVGLETSLVITTNKRVYHLKLISRNRGHTPYVGFLYQEQALALSAKDKKDSQWQTTTLAQGQAADLSGLNFGYQIKGKASWKPERVYNDGRKTFIKLPDSARQSEVPVLLAMQGKKEMLVNYRFLNNTFEVDGLFEHLILVSGVGGGQQKINIRKEKKK